MVSVDQVDGTSQFESGLEVRVVEEETGRLVSSIGQSDDEGMFELRLSDNEGNYKILVSSGIGERLFALTSLDLADFLSSDDATLKVQRIDPVQVSGRVQGGDSNGSLIGHATLQFFSDQLDSLRGVTDSDMVSHTATAVTDMFGRFSVQLLPGEYSATVTPPQDESSWGVLSNEMIVVEEASGQQSQVNFTLPQQIKLTGSVVDFAERSAHGMSIQVRSQVGYARTQEISTDSQGEFSVGLDKGLYNVSVRPPSPTNYPWLVDLGLMVTPDRGNVERLYSLSAPIVVRGAIYNGSDQPVSNARIEAYVFVSDGGTEDAKAVQVGDAVTEQDGTYQLVISPAWGE